MEVHFDRQSAIIVSLACSKIGFSAIALSVPLPFVNRSSLQTDSANKTHNNDNHNDDISGHCRNLLSDLRKHSGDWPSAHQEHSRMNRCSGMETGVYTYIAAAEAYRDLGLMDLRIVRPLEAFTPFASVPGPAVMLSEVPVDRGQLGV